MKFGKSMAQATILLLVVAVFSVSCSSVPFEEKRGDVLVYLRGFNNIENSLYEATAMISFEVPTEDGSTLDAYDKAMGQYIAAFDDALGGLAQIKPSPLERDTTVHLGKAESWLFSSRQTLEALRQSIVAGDQASIAKRLVEVADRDAEVASINKATEKLLVSYKLSDAEANYRFRNGSPPLGNAQ